MAGLGDMTLKVTADLPLSDVDAFKAKLGQTKETIQQLKGSVSDINAALSQNATNLASVSDNLIKVRSSSSASTATIAGLETQISELRNENISLNTSLVTVKSSLDAETASLKEQSSAAAISQRSQDALGKAVGRFTDGNLVAAREVNNLGRRILNIGSIAAFSALSAGVSLVSTGLEYLFDKYINVESASNKAKAAQEALNQQLLEASKNALATGARLQDFVKIAQDSTLPLQQRNNALADANKILGEHADKLTLVNISTAAAVKEVNDYTQALVNEAVAAKYADTIADLKIQQINASKTYTQALKDEAKARQFANDIGSIGSANITSGGSGLNTSAADASAAAYRKLVDAATNYRTISDQLISVNADLYNTELKVTSQTEEHTKATKKTGETIEDVLKKLKAQLDLFKSEEINLKVDKAKESISAIQDALNTLTKKFGLGADSKIILNLEAQIGDLDFREFKKQLATRLREFRQDGVDIDEKVKINLTPAPVGFSGGISADTRKEIANYQKQLQAESLNVNNSAVFDFATPGQPALKGLDTYKGDTGQIISLQKQLTTEGVKFKTTDSFGSLLKSQEDYTKNLATLNSSFQKTVNGIEVGVVTDLAQGIGNLINGTGSAGDIFKSLFTTIADGFESLGKALIAFALAKSVINDFKNISPATALIAGIGLEIAGAVLKSSIPGFANGVTGFGGGTALVGERGPELVVLPSAASVIPNHRLGNINSGNSEGGFVASYVLRGADILTTISRAQGQNSRNT